MCFHVLNKALNPWPLLRAEDVTVSRTDVVPDCRVAPWWGHRHSVSSRKAAPAPLDVFAGPLGSQGRDRVERVWGGCYQTEHRPARLSAAKPINRQWVVVKERGQRLYCRRQVRRMGSSHSKDPNSRMAFREGVFKGNIWGEGCSF